MPIVGRNSSRIPINVPAIVPSHVRKDTKMNNDYRTRVNNYLISRSYFASLLEKGEISEADFNKINKKLLTKYHVSKRSVFNSN